MRHALGTIAALVAVIGSPWPLAVLLALALALFEPLIPFVAGAFADMLYYAPHAGAVPLGTLCGALATGIAFFVRSRLKTSIIGE